MSEIREQQTPAEAAPVDVEACLETLVGGGKTGGGLSLGDALRRLDGFSRAPGVDPRLRHFLERRSYVKALEHLRSGRK